MKSAYDTALYDFYTSEENYPVFAKIANEAPRIAEALVREFWKAAEIALAERAKKWDGNWYILPPAKFEERYAGINIAHESWKETDGNVLVSIRTEDIHYGRHPSIGIWCNQDYSGVYDYNKIVARFRAFEALSEYIQNNNEWWAKWKYLPFHFKDYQELEKLIPSNRDTAIKDLIDEVEAIKNAIEGDVAGIIANSKI